MILLNILICSATLLFLALALHDLVNFPPLTNLVDMKKYESDARRYTDACINGLFGLIPLTLLLFYRTALPGWALKTIIGFYGVLLIGAFFAWYVPYFFGSSASHREAFKKFENTHHFLPKRGENIVPNTFHVILHVMMLACLTLAFTLPSPKIITSASIADIEQHSADQKTLVLLDLDQTVFDVTGTVHEHWFSHMLNHAQTLGHTYESALKELVPHYVNAMSKAPPVIPAEDGTARVIKQLQQRGINVMGLTARGAMLSASTQKQLNSIDIDFNHTSIVAHSISLPMTKETAHFERGILFCGPNSKGDALKTFLNAVSHKPEKIVFVDDKEHHLKSVMNMADASDIDFVGIRYSRLDAKMHAYVLDDASKQLLKPPAASQLAALSIPASSSS